MSEAFLAAQEEWERQRILAEQEREQAELELASQIDPEVAGKQGPAFVPGASEEAAALRSAGGDEKYLEWARSQGLSNEDIVKMAEERKNANAFNTGIAGYETPTWLNGNQRNRKFRFHSHHV